MIVLVSDTSVLIDLERGGLLEVAFSCGHQLVVPDLLYVLELEPENGPLLKAMGLQVVELTAEEVAFAQAAQSTAPTLSFPDCFAPSCARRPQHMLVTDDMALRRKALEVAVPCRGLLWLLDEMKARGAIAAISLAEGLERIAAHPRCRLPKVEVQMRIKKWRP